MQDSQNIGIIIILSTLQDSLTPHVERRRQMSESRDAAKSGSEAGAATETDFTLAPTAKKATSPVKLQPDPGTSYKREKMSDKTRKVRTEKCLNSKKLARGLPMHSHN